MVRLVPIETTARQGRFIGLALVLGGLGVAGMLSCATERPVTPIPAGYNLYVGSGVGMVFVLDAESLTVRDSIILADTCIIYDVEATTDGRRLFASLLAESGRRTFTAEIDAPSLTVSYEWSDRSYADLVISDRGKTLVREFLHLELTDIETKSIYQVPMTIAYIEGMTDGTHVGGISYTGDTAIVYDVSRREVAFEIPVKTTSGEAVRVSTALPIPERDLLLVMGSARVTRGAFFLAVRMSDGTTLFQHPIYGTQGKVTVTPDLSRAIVVSHGEVSIGNPYGHLDIFSLSRLEHLKGFTQADFPTYSYPADDVECIPGTTRALVSVGFRSAAPIVEIDWGTLEMTPSDDTARRWSGAISIGPRF
jgi:hypothetical protein